MHWRAMTDKETLGAWDLADKAGNPKDFTLEIVRVQRGLVQSKEKPKGEHRPFIYFKNAQKPLVCNATNAETISAMAGSEDTDRWIGLRVTLYQTRVKSKGGKPVQGIRIRPMKASGPVDEIGAGNPVDEAMRAEQNEAMDREPGEDG
jgi:hypothetical protein